jgi:hypothetical protein
MLPLVNRSRVVSGVETLSQEDCYSLLQTADLGRFAVISGRYPVVFPVNFTLDEGVITFRTGSGTKLRAALHSDISFEADWMSPDRTSAWSVLVFGSVDHNGIAVDGLERRDHLDVQPIDPSEKPAWVRINVHHITGRRYTKNADGKPAFDAHAYL